MAANGDIPAGNVIHRRAEFATRFGRTDRPRRAEGASVHVSRAISEWATDLLALLWKLNVVRHELNLFHHRTDSGEATHIPLDDPLVTNVCFGGPDGGTATCTGSGQGTIFTLPWPSPGLGLHR